MVAHIHEADGQEVARARRLLSACRLVLLDMNGTFMFGEDRLGPSEDFGSSYRASGGRALSDEAVTHAVQACVGYMARLYDNPAFVDDFPRLDEVLSALPGTAELPERERTLLAQVIGRHELGLIPRAHADTVRALARTHRLALVSNLWSPKDLWLAELTRAGLGETFVAQVFSSDLRSLKPSPVLFRQALRGCGELRPGPYRDVVVVGDSLRCDVGGAQAMGLRSIWISPSGDPPPATGPQPDAWVRDLCDLVPPSLA